MQRPGERRLLCVHVCVCTRTKLIGCDSHPVSSQLDLTNSQTQPEPRGQGQSVTSLCFLSGMTFWGGLGVTAEVGMPSGASVILQSNTRLCLCKLFLGSARWGPGPVLRGISTRLWGLRLHPGPAGPVVSPRAHAQEAPGSCDKGLGLAPLPEGLSGVGGLQHHKGRGRGREPLVIWAL